MLGIFWWVVLMAWNLEAMFGTLVRLGEMYKHGGRKLAVFGAVLAVLNLGASAYCMYVIDGLIVDRYGGRVVTAIPTTIGPPSPGVK